MKMTQKSLIWIFAIVMGMTLTLQSAQAKVKPLEIEFVDLNGQTVKLSDFRGKWVVVNFWATWCPPCRMEIPDLTIFHDEHKDKDAVVLGVNYETGDPQKVKEFMKQQMINYPIVRLKGGANGHSTPFGPLRGLPTSYMISPAGEVVAGTTGMVSTKALNEFLKKYGKNYAK